MQRLTEKADLGNWCLKGVRWDFNMYKIGGHYGSTKFST